MATPSTVELDTLHFYTQTIQPGKVWLGLDDRVTPPSSCPNITTDGWYTWVTDENVVVPASGVPPWYPGDPLLPCTQRCVEMLNDKAVFDDASCGTPWASICECDDFPVDSAHL